MKTRQLFYTLTFFFLLSPVIAGAQENNTKMDQFIDRLMSKMTLKEKIGQLDLPTAGSIITGEGKSSGVAEKIRAISKSRQVICVTHLPQIASMADGHYVIEKKVTGNHTRTLVSRLGPEDRKKEIARMIGGSSLTPLSLQHAGELIESASQPKNS